MRASLTRSTWYDENMDDNKLARQSKVEEGEIVNRRKFNGRKPGTMNKATMEMKLARAAFVRRVNRNVGRLFNSQLDLALGEKYLMVVRTIGEGSRQRRETSIVSDPQTIADYLDGKLDDTAEREYYFMTTKPANNQAIDSLLNRSFGTPKQSVDLTSGDQPVRGATIVFGNPTTNYNTQLPS